MLALSISFFMILVYTYMYLCSRHAMLIQKQSNVFNITIVCITFVQCWTNVEDVEPTLYKSYIKVLCLLGYVYTNEVIISHINYNQTAEKKRS